MKKITLAPSVLAADFSDLRNALKYIELNNGSMVHLDIMDGRFVPEIAIGQPVVRSLRQCTRLPFDVHLMTEYPEQQALSFIKAGADSITFHYECTTHVNRLIQSIHEKGKKAGIAIVPSTPISMLSEIFSIVDIILVMTVNPGFGGQKLIPSCVNKVSTLSDIREKNNYTFKISVDGGIDENNISSVIDSGADIIVSGSAFFSGKLKGRVT